MKDEQKFIYRLRHGLDEVVTRELNRGTVEIVYRRISELTVYLLVEKATKGCVSRRQ